MGSSSVSPRASPLLKFLRSCRWRSSRRASPSIRSASTISFGIRSRRRAELTSITRRDPSRRIVPSVVLSQSLCLRLPALIQVNTAA